jgi:Recombination directionality factor-like
MASKSCADDRTDAGSPFTNCDGAQTVGRFGFGLVRNGRPGTLSTWRVSVRTSEIGTRVAMLFGGMPSVSIDGDKYASQVITEAVTVDVVLSGPHALRVRWRRDGCGRRCDGPEQSKRAECSCASLGLLADRKAAVRQGDGCMPSIEMSFRLRRDPALGLFTFISGNWSFAEQAIMAKAALDRLAGPIQVQLGLKQTCHTLHRGREVNYTRPTLALVGAVLHVRSGPRGDVTSASDSATPGQLAEPGRR